MTCTAKKSKSAKIDFEWICETFYKIFFSNDAISVAFGMNLIVSAHIDWLDVSKSLVTVLNNFDFSSVTDLHMNK